MEAVRESSKVKSADDLDNPGLADHLPQLLDDLTHLLRGQSVTRHIDRHTDSHGRERWRQDYSLAEVVQELGIICRVVLVHGLNAFEDAHPDAPKAELRQAQEQILRFFEDTSAGSVRQYAVKQHEQLDALNQQLREADRSLASAAQAERDRLADVFKRSPSFMAILRGPTHVFERVNDHYYQLVGHRELLGKPVREALPEIAGQGFFELLDQVYATGEPFVGKNMRAMLERAPGSAAGRMFSRCGVPADLRAGWVHLRHPCTRGGLERAPPLGGCAGGTGRATAAGPRCGADGLVAPRHGQRQGALR